MDPKKALNIAAGLCSKKEYCSFDIRQKLSKWEIADDEQVKILEFLIKNKFIDENRFALAYARDKFRFNKWGKVKISQMLKQKGISSGVIAEALTGLSDDHYSDTCLELLKQKRKSIKDNEPQKIKAKLFRFALARGFDYDTIGRNILTLLAECDD